MISLGHADPNFIKNLFLTPEVNGSRIFGVNFHDLGVQTTIVIDDYIPFSSSRPLYSKASDNKGLWPVILEKAFAKFHGNYRAIESGSVDRSVEVLTGFPGFYKRASDFTVDSLWAFLSSETA